MSCFVVILLYICFGFGMGAAPVQKASCTGGSAMLQFTQKLNKSTESGFSSMPVDNFMETESMTSELDVKGDQSYYEYADMGDGQCKTHGRTPRHSFLAGKHENGCKDECNKAADCHGYSWSRHHNCLLWLEGSLKEGPAWGKARCWAKVGKWTDWSNHNHNGFTKNPLECGYALGYDTDHADLNDYVSSMKFFEKSSFGIVDIWLNCKEAFRKWNARDIWCGGSSVCEWNRPLECGAFQWIQFMEEGGYGLINARAGCIDGSETGTSNSNFNGKWNKRLECPK